MKRKIFSLVGILCCSAMLFGCAGKSQTNTFTGAKVEVPAYQDNLNAVTPQAYSNVDGLNLEAGTYISIIGKETNSAFWKTVAAGAAQAGEDLNTALGYKGDDKVKVTYNAPESGENIDEQVNILDEELSRYPDALGIASIDEDACAVQFDLAAENDIPLVALDSGNSYQGILSTCETDNVEASRTGMKNLCEEIDGSGEVMILLPNSQSTASAEREEGAKAEVKENYPDVQIVETLQVDKFDDLKKIIADKKNEGLDAEDKNRIEAENLTDQDVLAYYFEKHPNVKGIYTLSEEMTTLALDTLEMLELDEEDTKDTAKEEESEEEKSGEEKSEEEDSGKESSDKGNDPTDETQDNPNDEADENQKKIVFIGFDAGKTALEALEEGEIQGLVVQNPFGMGYAAVIAAARSVLGEGNEAVVNTGYIWVTQENLENESIQNMLYR